MNVSETGNLSRAYRLFGWGGGTIYEVASQLGMPGRGCELAFKVGVGWFCGTNRAAATVSPFQ